MRRLAGLLVVPLLLLSTAACGDDKGSDSASTSNGLPAITAGQKFGEKPTLAKGEGKPPKDLKVEVISEGKGQTLKKGDQAQVNYLGQLWDGDKPFDNSFDRGEPFPVTIGGGGVIEGWQKALDGQKVGSRLEVSIPPALGYGATGQGDIPPNATLVFVMDIVKGTTLPTTAKGTDVAQDNLDLPKIGTNTDGKAPSITVPQKPAPTKLVSNYVIEGSGPAVKAGDTVAVQYKGVLWKDGKEFDSSYSKGAPVTFPLASVIPGWSKGLEGKKVGSRVLLVVPPDMAYGDQARGPIPAKSTLVFSVDILAVL
ncbi:FKBP-type peptidyl-prolyl cis-trans isomerase [Streptomyces sp. NBC_01619]|uniref:FKBP-type peptidyl-prolyl cis-trans isomerase n=1 Tax=Streptomyces pratisoli TaxID=3139917 RepID=A0ACC6QCQ6_9ACTN|nr:MULTISPECIES: FKBP-type peptidyl-prolyl cis-trans isomerase [unclassified Streptomyces]MCX4510107.1 FKBP-type peptidyl-prolyl cis-trans isomerase [Streptomyces sp. NBC_01619]